MEKDTPSEGAAERWSGPSALRKLKQEGSLCYQLQLLENIIIETHTQLAFLKHICLTTSTKNKNITN